MQKTAANVGIAKEYKTIFDIKGIPSFQQFYFYGIFIWKWLWKGFYKPWHIVPAHTIKDPNGKREMHRLNLAKAVCAEMAGLVWGDDCGVTVSTKGRNPEDKTEDPLDVFMQDVLEKNAFHQKMQESIEEGLALGGGAIKTWAEIDTDGEGEQIPDSTRMVIGYAMADQFIPLAWDNAKVTEGVFISRIAKDGWYYTRLEWHRWNGKTYTVTNELFRSEITKGETSAESQDILGVRYPLEEIYPNLEPYTEIAVKESLFCYWRTPIANNVDDNSPLGVSVYANALETLHALDICYDSFVREFQLGKKRIIVPASAVRMVVNPETGETVRYFDETDEVYQALQSDSPNDLKITDNSVSLRVEEHIAAINAFLSILCMQVGFSAGTFTFDQHEGLKTATEVVSENSKTYKTIKTIQKQLRPAIKQLVRNIIDVAVLYGIGNVAELIKPGYEINVTFDDGVTQDRQTNINEGVMLVGAGIISKKRFLTDSKYGIGMTNEEAEKELAQVRAETPASVNALDIFNSAE